MSEDNCSILKGRIISGVGGLYKAQSSDGSTYLLRCKRKFRHMHISPLVGDLILFTPGKGEEDGWIEEILPRKSQCVRPPVANVELMGIVVAPVPEPDLLLVDRLMVAASRQNMARVIIATKQDLSDEFAGEIARQYEKADVDVISVCPSTNQGIDKLRDVFSGKLCCLAGQSGVGKSTLINALLGTNEETGEISKKIQRGKNTTRCTTLLSGNDITILDTVGFSLLEIEGNMKPEELKECYPDFTPYEGRCRFSTCLHTGGGGCAVDEAVRDGELPRERYERYRILLEEANQKWRQRYD